MYVIFDPDRSTLTSPIKHNLKGRNIVFIALEQQETDQKTI